MPPKNQLTLTTRTWLGIITAAVSIVGSIWTFTITVSSDIREIRTDVHAVHVLMTGMEKRIERLEGAVYTLKP